MVLKVVPAFWLRETHVETTWGALCAPGGFLERVMKDLPPDIESDEILRTRARTTTRST